jgi:hypothetical protein
VEAGRSLRGDGEVPRRPGERGRPLKDAPTRSRRRNRELPGAHTSRRRPVTCALPSPRLRLVYACWGRAARGLPAWAASLAAGRRPRGLDNPLPPARPKPPTSAGATVGVRSLGEGRPLRRGEGPEGAGGGGGPA